MPGSVGGLGRIARKTDMRHKIDASGGAFRVICLLLILLNIYHKSPGAIDRCKVTDCRGQQKTTFSQELDEASQEPCSAWPDTALGGLQTTCSAPVADAQVQIAGSSSLFGNIRFPRIT